jgi:ABC-2 type transport system permease protein
VGLCVGGLIVRYGGKVQNFAWSMVFLIAPFSAIYYPLSALPVWAQRLALIVPSSYVFEGARQVILTGVVDGNKIGIAFALNLLYVILALIFFKKSFDKVLQRGLVKLY